MSAPDSQGSRHIYRLERAGPSEDSNRRLWSRVGRENGFRRWTGALWRRKWAASAVLVLALALAGAWLATSTTEAVVEIELEVRSGGPGSSPAERVEINRVVRQLDDPRVVVEVVRRMRLDRIAEGDTVADRTEAAAETLASQIQVRTGEPGRVIAAYEHRNSAHAAQFLNLLADVYIAKRDTLEPLGGQTPGAGETSTDVLQRARRELADFLRLNPVSRIEPQKRTNRDRIAELTGEIQAIDLALENVGDTEAARSLRVRREDFQKMRGRHEQRLAELDRMDLRLATLERRVRDAEELVARGPGAVVTSSALAPPETEALSQVAVARRARASGMAGVPRSAVLAAAALAGLLVGALLAWLLDRRARPPYSTTDLGEAAGLPVLALKLNEEESASVS